MINQHKTIKDNITKFNKTIPLVDYLIPFVKDKEVVLIADLGSGPFSKIGRFLKGALVRLYPSDIQDFTDFYKKYKVIPLFSIDRQDMERLSYPDNYFDIVHCSNALDHTKNALQAVKEMIRVCKPGGWIYIECHLDQLDTGHKHYWNAREDGGFFNKDSRFNLKDLGFSIKYINKGGERRYNYIVATLKK